MSNLPSVGEDDVVEVVVIVVFIRGAIVVVLRMSVKNK